jgi:hypothetical protein
MKTGIDVSTFWDASCLLEKIINSKNVWFRVRSSSDLPGTEVSWIQGRRGGGRAGTFYRGPRLNGGPEEPDYGARNRQNMKEPYNVYRGPSILSTALAGSGECLVSHAASLDYPDIAEKNFIRDLQYTKIRCCTKMVY